MAYLATGWVGMPWHSITISDLTQKFCDMSKQIAQYVLHYRKVIENTHMLILIS